MFPKFQFFLREAVTDAGSDRPLEVLRKLRASKTAITSASSGLGRLVLATDKGDVLMLNRQFEVALFSAHRVRTQLVYHVRAKNWILTVGEDDESSLTPVLSLWNLDHLDPSGDPHCIRSFPVARGVVVSCVEFRRDLSLVAVGLANGSVLLYRDLVRDAGTAAASAQQARAPPEPLVLQAGRNYPVTGLSLVEADPAPAAAGARSAARPMALFVATTDAIVVYHFAPDGSVSCQELEDSGCELSRSVIDDEGSFVVARRQLVQWYSADVRGQCQGLEGDKRLLHWFRNYLVVVTQDSNNVRFNTLNVYDIRNKLIAFSDTFNDISHVVSEWGCIFVFTHEGFMFQLEEKDTQTKLQTLFNMKLFGIAVNLAVSAKLDQDIIVEIYRQYGDYLQSKGEYDSAVAKYIMTIGKLEPSHVIRNFLDAQRIHSLTSYLQALHERGVANSDHTTLLLQCYTKLKDVNRLDQFLKADSRVKFDVETAIRVCRQAGYYTHALYLSRRHHQHSWLLKILVEDLHKYAEAVEYVSSLSFYEAEESFALYGKELVTNLPEPATQLAVSLCVRFVPSGIAGASVATSVVGGDDSGATGPAAAGPPPSVTADPEQFIPLFVNQPDSLAQFLEAIINRGGSTSVLVWNTLLEVYLKPDDRGAMDINAVRLLKERKEKALALLGRPRAYYSDQHALMLVQAAAFHEGIQFMYKRMGLYKEAVEYAMEAGNIPGVMEYCKAFATKDPQVWVQALHYFSAQETDCEPEIKEVLSHIERLNLLPPLPVVRILARKKRVQLGVIRDYISRRLVYETQQIAEEQHLIRKYTEETEKMRVEIDELKTGATVFQLNKCVSCSHPLDLPAVHFLCMHSFHLRCLGDNETECPLCAPENRKVADIMRSLAENAHQHDQFFNQLRGATDGFKTIAEYFGRGLFADSASGAGGAGPASAAGGYAPKGGV
jgi:tetratricopeptide (TPR) repeat protein